MDLDDCEMITIVETDPFHDDGGEGTSAAVVAPRPTTVFLVSTARASRGPSRAQDNSPASASGSLKRTVQRIKDFSG